MGVTCCTWVHVSADDEWWHPNTNEWIRPHGAVNFVSLQQFLVGHWVMIPIVIVNPTCDMDFFGG